MVTNEGYDAAVDPALLGTVLGIAFAAVDLTVLASIDDWPATERLRVLTATALVRFATGFLLGAVELGIAGWLSGLIVGGALSLPLARIDRSPRRVLAMGLAGGLWVGVLGAALRQGIVLG